jgi:hypothetical protein
METPSKLAQAMALLSSVQQVTGSNPGGDIDYPEVSSWFSSVHTEKCPDFTLNYATARLLP